MKAIDVIVWITIVSNALLWGGIGIGFLWLAISDPTLPEDAGLDVATTNVMVESAAPRHRA